MKALIVTAAVVLAGCAGPTPSYWYKAGATERDFNMAMARCRMGVAALPDHSPNYPPRSAGEIMTQAGRDLGDAAAIRQYGDDCLIADGWYKGPKP